VRRPLRIAATNGASRVVVGLAERHLQARSPPPAEVEYLASFSVRAAARAIANYGSSRYAPLTSRPRDCSA